MVRLFLLSSWGNSFDTSKYKLWHEVKETCAHRLYIEITRSVCYWVKSFWCAAQCAGAVDRCIVVATDRILLCKPVFNYLGTPHLPLCMGEARLLDTVRFSSSNGGSLYGNRPTVQCYFKNTYPRSDFSPPVITTSWSCGSAEFCMLFDCAGLSTIGTSSNHTGLQCLMYLAHRRREFEVRDPQFFVRLSSNSLPSLRHFIAVLRRARRTCKSL
jgi:hypothetical protein